MFIFNSILDFFIPKICYACGNPLAKNENFLCQHCIQSIEISNIEDCIDHKLAIKEKHFNHIFYYSQYGGVLKDIIHIFKYEHRPELAKTLAELLLYRMNEMRLLLHEYDYILFVPMHPVKKRERGFNQSEELAMNLSELSDIPVLNNAVKRIHNGISQTRISLNSRLKNVNNNFAWGKNAYKTKNKNILLIDDVVTTGSTLNEVSKVISLSSPKSIDCLTLASAKGN